MVVIHKGQQPNELLVDKQSGIKRYENLPKKTLDAIRISLINEQGSLCAYCMRRISLDDKVKVEHYNARNPEDNVRDDDTTVDYNNLLIVCSGNEGFPYNMQTCDTRKGNQKLIVNPFLTASISQIAYKMDGRIYSDNSDINNDLNYKLNLNCPGISLKENRKAALTTLLNRINKDMKGKHAPPEYWLKLRKEIGDRNPKVEYLGILLWYIKRHMR